MRQIGVPESYCQISVSGGVGIKAPEEYLFLKRK